MLSVLQVSYTLTVQINIPPSLGWFGVWWNDCSFVPSDDQACSSTDGYKVRINTSEVFEKLSPCSCLVSPFQGSRTRHQHLFCDRQPSTTSAVSVLCHQGAFTHTESVRSSFSPDIRSYFVILPLNFRFLSPFSPDVCMRSTNQRESSSR